MLRLFLSVDIQGSTNLKNKFNYTTLYGNFVERKDLISELLRDGKIKNDSGNDDITFCENLALDSIKNYIDKTNDWDWHQSQKRLFEDFNSHFLATFQKSSSNKFSVAEVEKFLWKSIGDELVYVLVVKDRESIHTACCSFLVTLNYIDEKLSKNSYYRLKGSAWTAGFPIRNREIEFPFPSVFYPVKSEANTDYLPYDYPRLDFIGPDIDIGFRLGKYSWPGILVVSMDLAQLLSEYRGTDKLPITFVGWENLKGVWNNIHYPIFWATLNDKHLSTHDLPKYTPYKSSEIALSKNLELFVSGGSNKVLESISDIRIELPDYLGLIKPYLEEDKDDLPAEHKKILELIEKLKRSEDIEAMPKQGKMTEEERSKILDKKFKDSLGNKFIKPN
ncbi:hypothetical protein [Leptospira perdikensis]|uniref:Uncharacterized protein n=1 Tax=Leptospira perdikensis TaxID=2484948 RepID=A0A4R9JBC6_9LEPT|nr:hypothetical protein [Leptospira perdikensis]TGL35588.1 hypothetical protein EHQ49_17585 [Leptospira perdikensis]